MTIEKSGAIDTTPSYQELLVGPDDIEIIAEQHINQEIVCSLDLFYKILLIISIMLALPIFIVAIILLVPKFMIYGVIILFKAMFNCYKRHRRQQV